MAAQVLSGTGNVSYTNSTGQNVRLVINYLRIGNKGGDMTVSFPGNSITLAANMVYGKTLGYRNSSGETNVLSSMAAPNHGHGNITQINPLPLEIALANGDTFSATGNSNNQGIDGYNIIIIPEAG